MHTQSVSLQTSPRSTWSIRALFVLTLLFAGILSATAQSAFYLGTQAGINGSKFKHTEDLLELYPTTERLVGATVGIEGGIQLGRWNFGTGLNYVQMGSKYQTDNFETNEGQTGFFRATERHHVITVPVVAGYSDYLTDRIGYKIEAGPNFHFGLSGKIDETTEYFEEIETDYQNHKVAFGAGVNDDYKGVQTTLRFSPSLFFDVSRNHRLSLNAAWDLGFGDSYNERYKLANQFFKDNRGSQTNRVASLTVGYQYRIPFADRY